MRQFVLFIACQFVLNKMCCG